jgi:replicative DNA helicase
LRPAGAQLNAPIFTSLPENQPAEQHLLGSLLLSNAAFERVSESLRPEHFIQPVHGRIFAEIARMVGAGSLASPVTIANRLTDHAAALEELGGAAGYLAALCGSVVSILDVGPLSEHLIDLAHRRELIGLAGQLEMSARDTASGKTADQIQEEIETGLFEAALSQRSTVDRTRSFSACMDATLAQIAAAMRARADGRVVGVTTGLVDLDRRIGGGLKRSDLIIAAGRASMGKTALAFSIAVEAARAGKSVIYASLEMSGEQLTMRAMAAESGIPGDRSEAGELTAAEFDTLYDRVAALRSLNLFIDDTAALSPATLRTRARRRKRSKTGLDLIVVDYLQLMGPPQRDASRVREVSDITAALKALAKDLDVPVMALSQLNRTVEGRGRDERRPQLSDLRESGSIEQDADVVMFVYREEYYLQFEEPKEGCKDYLQKWSEWRDRKAACAGIAEIIVGKNRRGPVGTVRVHFDNATTKFSNLARGDANA